MKDKDEKIKALVIIDCQNDFITGALANPEAQRKVPNIVKKIDEFDGGIIFYTRDTHDNTYLNSNEGKKLPVVHCIKGTEGWDIQKDVAHAIVGAASRGIEVRKIEKPTFGSEHLARSLGTLCFGEDGGENAEIEICGFCTDICVVSNALMIKAATYDCAEITVDGACCAGVTVDSHKAALTTMKMCQINVINENN